MDEPKEQDSEEAKEALNLNGEVALNGVNFSYKKDKKFS